MVSQGRRHLFVTPFYGFCAKWKNGSVLLLDLPVVAREGPGVGGVGGAAGEVPVAQAAALTPLQDVV